MIVAPFRRVRPLSSVMERGSQSRGNTVRTNKQKECDDAKFGRKKGHVLDKDDLKPQKATGRSIPLRDFSIHLIPIHNSIYDSLDFELPIVSTCIKKEEEESGDEEDEENKLRTHALRPTADKNKT